VILEVTTDFMKTDQYTGKPRSEIVTKRYRLHVDMRSGQGTAFDEEEQIIGNYESECQ